MTSTSSAKPDPLETKREQALVQQTAALIVLTRRKAEELREAMVERDSSQGAVTRAAVEFIEQLATAALPEEILEVIADDLGDAQAEALQVTR